MTPRTSIPTALLALAALAAPATASAAGVPKPPKFRVRIQATQTSTFKQPYFKTDQDCFSRPWSQGQGSQTITMKGSGTAYVQRLGKTALWTYNSPDFGPGGTRGIQLKTSITRSKSARWGVDPGPCGGGGPAQDGVYDCPSKGSSYNGLMTWRGRRLNLLTTRNDDAPRVDYPNCRIYFPPKVNELALTEIGQVAPISEVTDPAFGKQIILARTSFDHTFGAPGSQKLITSTTVRWQITLYRVK